MKPLMTLPNLTSKRMMTGREFARLRLLGAIAIGLIWVVVGVADRSSGGSANAKSRVNSGTQANKTNHRYT